MLEVKQIDYNYLVKNLNFDNYDTIFDNVECKYEDETLYGLFLDNKVIGLASFSNSFEKLNPDLGKGIAFLSAFEIDKNYRNNTYGTQFISMLEEMVKNQKVKIIYIYPLFEDKIYRYWKKLGYNYLRVPFQNTSYEFYMYKGLVQK